MSDKIFAHDLPDGTTIWYGGEEWTAYPEADIAGAPIRWHSSAGLASDGGMDGMLADGAKVTGRVEGVAAEYLAIMLAAGR